MFIDIHVHVRKKPGPLRWGKPPFSTPEQLLSRYDEIGVEQAVLLPGVNPECCYQPQSMEEVLEICEAHPGRFIPFMNVDPRAVGNHWQADLGLVFSHYKERGCRGIGEICANLWFLDPMVQNLFAHAEQFNLPLTFHIAPQAGGYYGLIDQPGLGQLEESLRRFPKLKFFGHSQAFWAEIAELRFPEDRRGYPNAPVEKEGAVPRLMRAHTNLYGDLSAHSGFNALNRDPDYAIRFLNEFQDRLFFGTDICAPDTTTPLAPFLIDLRNEGKISEAVFQKIARENALNVLGLTSAN